MVALAIFPASMLGRSDSIFFAIADFVMSAGGSLRLELALTANAFSHLRLPIRVSACAVEYHLRPIGCKLSDPTNRNQAEE